MLLTSIWLGETAKSVCDPLATVEIAAIERLLQDCSSSSGGFRKGSSPTSPAYVETTKYAVGIFECLAACGYPDIANEKREGCIDYLLRHLTSAGGFSDEPNREPMILATYFATMALEAMGALEDHVKAGCINYLLSAVGDSGLPHGPGFPPDTTTIFWSAMIGRVCGEPDCISKESVAKFFRGCRKEDGSYSSFANARMQSRLQPTAEVLLTQNCLELRDDNEMWQSIKFLRSCEDSPAKFGERPGVRPTPRDSLFGTLALYGLTRSCPVRRATVHTEDLWMCHTSIYSHVISSIR